MNYRRDQNRQMQAYLSKNQYLKDMLGRLENEVGKPMEFFKKFNEQNTYFIGFWALIRLIMPVVESLGKVKYKGVRDSWEYSSNILRDLGVPYPKIAWKLFRDCLIHGDEMLNVIDDEREMYSGWKIDIGGGHVKQKLNPCIDLEELYYDLYREIEHLIDSGEEEETEFRAIRFSTKQIEKDHELKKELDELFG